MADILIVEDSATQAEMLSAMLEEDGHRVTAAVDGEQALAFLLRLPSMRLITVDGRLGQTAARHTSQEFVAFLEEVVGTQPVDRQVHVILDNFATHKTELVKSFCRYEREQPGSAGLNPFVRHS